MITSLNTWFPRPGLKSSLCRESWVGSTDSHNLKKLSKYGILYLPTLDHFIKSEKRHPVLALLHSVMTEANNNVVFQQQQILDILTINKSYVDECMQSLRVSQNQNFKIELFPGRRGKDKRGGSSGLPLVPVGSPQADPAILRSKH